ncbi:MAG: hypothetical protein ABL958_04000 [Bdellovibrionia bacterium]
MRFTLLLVVAFCFSWAVTNTAQAQYVLERLDAPPHDLRALKRPLDSFTPFQAAPADTAALTERAKKLAATLVAQYKAATETIGTNVACDSNQLPAHLRGLRLLGRAGEAEAYGEKCLYAEGIILGDQERHSLILETAASAIASLHFKKAMGFYDLANAGAYSALGEYRLGILEQANLALRTEYQDQVSAILKKDKTWNAAQVKLAQAMLEMFFLGTSPLATETEILKFVDETKSSGGPRLRSYLNLNMLQHLDRNRYDYDGALAYLEKNVNEMLDPSEWVDNAYSVFYHQKDGQNFMVAQVIYDGYHTYAHMFAWLPVETNTKNYTETYGGSCRDNLSSGASFTSLLATRADFLAGAVDANGALGVMKDLVGKYGERADINDFVAHLLTRQNKDDAAAGMFFRSHTMCSSYNRSHWGLVNVLRRKRHHAYSDYEKRLEIMKAELEQLPAMSELSTYIVNWNGLDNEARLRLKYSLRFWKNHLGHLQSSGARVYIKRGFELMSQIPGMEKMRDLRVSYPGDNRLWDDIRGLGGEMVLVDLEEMMDGPFGVYNLAGHEVAHQFHFSLPATLQGCIDKLYAQAKTKKVFADPYSSTNPAEYFAQGVGYQMWPEGSPARFGLNRKWLLDNDRDLDAFLTSILNAKAISEIKCPLN